MVNVPDRYAVKNEAGLIISSWQNKSNAITAGRAAYKRKTGTETFYVVDTRINEIVWDHAHFERGVRARSWG